MLNVIWLWISLQSRSQQLWLLLAGLSGALGLSCLIVFVYLMISNQAARVKAIEPDSQVVIESLSQEEVEVDLVVEISGAVKQPGVYQLPPGSRVVEVLEKAGGALSAADNLYIAREINLASKVADGQKIYLPFKSENLLQSKPTSGDSNQAFGGLVQVNLNTATLEQLESLPGIGQVRAQKIVENRPYSSINDLVDKDVLSEGTFEDLADLVKI